MTQQPHIKLNDGQIMPQLGLGVWQADNKQVISAVETALDAGYRAIDTAAIYENEEGVGSALHNASLPREELFITTKLWNNRHGSQAPQQALEESLIKLKLDYVDLYLIHWPVPQQGKFVETWKALIKLKEQGLIKSIGVSNFNSSHIQKLLDETGVSPTVNQIELHPLFQQRQMHSWNATHHIATESWSPLAQGGDGVFDHAIITALSIKYGKTPAQIVIRWHLDNGLLVIPKSVTPARIRENFNVLDFRLDKDELGKIATLDISKRLGPDPETFKLGID